VIGCNLTLGSAVSIQKIAWSFVMSTDNREKHKEEKKIDKAVDMTYPASDPTAKGKPTGTEPPRRPVERKAPRITKEQIKQAQRGEGHKSHGGR
jgi:hypothetical protein